MSRLAVIHLTFSWPPMGGATRDIHEILRRAAGQHEVRLFLPSFPKIFSRCRVEGSLPYDIQRIPFTPLSFNYRTAGERFREAVDAFAPDLLFVGDGWHLKPWIFNAMAAYRPILRFYTYENLCLLRNGIRFRNGAACPHDFLHSPSRCLRCAITHRQHAFWYRMEQLTGGILLPSYLAQVRRMITGARGVIVYNSATGAMVAPLNDQVRVVHSGVDTGAFPVSPEPVNPMPRIFAPGRLDDPCKGLKLLLAAMDLLWSEGHRFTLAATVKGCPDRPYLRRLGWLDAVAMAGEYERCNLVIVPAVWPEPQGIVVLEGMAAGRAVVGTDLGGIPAMIQPGHTGLLSAPDPPRLARTVAELLTDPGSRAAMGREGARVARERFDWDRIYDSFYAPLFAAGEFPPST
ncbi:glycosyltransferase family 4 protein [bacterium]|nr:glycosyltransferase family 4 protein [candidate division CSSED10-310 bacterium]